MSIAPLTDEPLLISGSSRVFLTILTAVAIIRSSVQPVSLRTISISSLSDWYSRGIQTNLSLKASLSLLVATYSSGFWVAITRKPGLALTTPILGTTMIPSSIAGNSTFWVPSGILLSSFMNRKAPSNIACVKGPGIKDSQQYPLVITEEGSNHPTSLCSVYLSSPSTRYILRPKCMASAVARTVLPTPTGPSNSMCLPALIAMIAFLSSSSRPIILYFLCISVISSSTGTTSPVEGIKHNSVIGLKKHLPGLKQSNMEVLIKGRQHLRP